jgi:hypothetical protein
MRHRSESILDGGILFLGIAVLHRYFILLPLCAFASRRREDLKNAKTQKRRNIFGTGVITAMGSFAEDCRQGE